MGYVRRSAVGYLWWRFLGDDVDADMDMAGLMGARAASGGAPGSSREFAFARPGFLSCRHSTIGVRQPVRGSS